MNDGLELVTVPTDTVIVNQDADRTADRSGAARIRTPLTPPTPLAPSARRGYRKIDSAGSPMDGPMARAGFRELSVEMDVDRKIL